MVNREIGVHRSLRILAWVGGVLGGLIVVILITLALMNWDAMKGPIERVASTATGRKVAIAGHLEVHPFSWSPRISAENLTVGNPAWEQGAPPLLRVEKLELQLQLSSLLRRNLVLPKLQLIHPQVYLHRDLQGRANWTFENQKPTNAPAGPPTKVPAVRDLLIDDGKLVVHDEILKLSLEGTIAARQKGSTGNPKAFRLQAKGTLNQKPFATDITGGPLVNIDPDHPYPFDIQIEAGDIRVTAAGKINKPFDLGSGSLDVTASGSNLADQYYLTQLALPNTPPYKLALHIDRDGSMIHVPKLQGTVGGSDLEGSLLVDVSRKRPSISGHLTSKVLSLADLAAPLGSEPKAPGSPATAGEKPKPSKKGAAEPAPANKPLFPTARLQVKRVRAMNADVTFDADSIKAGSLPMRHVSFHIKLNDGDLALDPFSFEMNQGKLSGTAAIDTHGQKPRTKLDLRIRNFQLDQLKGKAPDAKPPFDGVLQGRVVLDGVGDSVHDFVADSNGQFTIVIPQGQITAAFPELTGIDVARGMGLLLKGSDARTELRCGVMQFAVQDGTMKSKLFVFDTTDVKITGSGDIRLGPEQLDLQIKGEPKKFRFTRVRTPIYIDGQLRKPKIGVNAGKLAAQGAVAAVLGAALTPFAAIAAFVDPGLAKDANCSDLLQQSHTPPTKTASKSDSGAPARR
jgi:AsmA family protein